MKTLNYGLIHICHLPTSFTKTAVKCLSKEQKDVSLRLIQLTKAIEVDSEAQCGE